MNKKTIITTTTIIAIIAIITITTIILLTPKKTEGMIFVKNPNINLEREGQIINIKEQATIRKGDTITSDEKGTATIILKDNSIITISPNSKITIKETEENTSIKQELGLITHTVSKLLGRSYQVETPTTLALVRGTRFITTNKKVMVDKGTVIVSDQKRTYILNPGEKSEITNGTLTKKNMTEEEKQLFKKATEQELTTYKEKRIALIKKDPLLNKAIKQYGEEEVKKLLEQIDKGEISEEEIIKKIPYKTRTIKEIQDVNKKIRELQR